MVKRYQKNFKLDHYEGSQFISVYDVEVQTFVKDKMLENLYENLCCTKLPPLEYISSVCLH